MVKPPTCAELQEMTCVFRDADDSWRHGSYVTQVFRRDEDQTYWQAKYRLSTDGETNELREGIATIVEVEPYEVKTTAYRVKEQKGV